MVCKVQLDEDATPLPLRRTISRPAHSSLDRLFAAGALRFEMDTEDAATCAFEDSYAKWLETVLQATILRNHQVEQSVKQLRTRNEQLRRRVTALKSASSRAPKHGKPV